MDLLNKELSSIISFVDIVEEKDEKELVFMIEFRSYVYCSIRLFVIGYLLISNRIDGVYFCESETLSL